jgi:hypothetical protein
MQTQKKSAATTQGNTIHAEPINLTKRIGSTTYVVAVHFSETNKERLEDKLLRLILREVEDAA